MHLKSYSELTFTDDFMFCKIMTTRLDLCKELLELILNIRIRELLIHESQKAIEPTYDGRGVRLDVYAEDDEKQTDRRDSNGIKHRPVWRQMGG